MNIVIKLSTGKEIDITESEMRELFGLFPTNKQPWYEPIPVFPVYPAYPNYPQVIYNTTC